MKKKFIKKLVAVSMLATNILPMEVNAATIMPSLASYLQNSLAISTNISLVKKMPSVLSSINLTNTNTKKDTTKPYCNTDCIRINNSKEDEITVNFGKIVDSSGINRVMIAVWTDKNGQDDLIWTKAEDCGNGAYRIKINRNQHKNEYGVYHIHAYIYDNYENCTAIPLSSNMIDYNSSYTGNLSNKDNTISASGINVDRNTPYYCNSVKEDAKKGDMTYDILEKDISQISCLSSYEKNLLTYYCNFDKEHQKAYKAFFVYMKSKGQSLSKINRIISDTAKGIRKDPKAKNLTQDDKYYILYCSLRDKLNESNYKKNMSKYINDACCLANKVSGYWLKCGEPLTRYINPKYSNVYSKYQNSSTNMKNAIPDVYNLKVNGASDDNTQAIYRSKYNVGSDKYFVDLYDMISKTSARNLYNSNVINFLNLIQSKYDEIYNSCTYSKAVNLQSSNIKVSDFSTKYDGMPMMDVQKGIKDGTIPLNDYDWYVALGSASGGIKATITRTQDGKSLNIILDYYLDDYYNFDMLDTTNFGPDKDGDTLNLEYKGVNVTLKNSISQEKMAILHMAGYAKEYEMMGKLTKTIQINRSTDIKDTVNKLKF